MTKWKGEVASCAPAAAPLVSSMVRAWGARLLPAALLMGLAAGSASGADLFWDANGTSVGAGGAGTWNTSTGNWSLNNDGVSGPYNPWNNGALDNALFAGTAGTVTLGVPITVHNLTFNTSAYTLTGNTLTLGGVTPTITVTSGTSTINSIIAGAAGLTKAGAGFLTLGGANTFSGGVNVNAGTLFLSAASSFTGNINLNGGVLRATNNAALGAAGNTITTTADATLTVDSGTTNRNVSIAGGSSLTVTGAGVGSALFTGSGNLIVTNGVAMSNAASNYTGTTTFYAAPAGQLVFAFNSIGNLGEASSLGAPTTVANGTISYIAGQFADNVNYTGDGDSSNRNWSIALANYAASLNNNGTGTLTLTGDIGIANSGAAGFSASLADLQLLGVISGGAGAGVSFGGGAGRTVTLGSSNSFTGSVSIGGATIVAPTLANSGIASSLGAGSIVALTDRGTLSYTGAGATSNRTWTSDGATAISNDGTGVLNLAGNLSFVAGGVDTLTLGGAYAGTNSLNGVISGSGGLASSGSGTWVLSGANTRSGTITMNGGTLRAGNASAFGTTTGLTINSGTLDLNGFNMSTATLEGTGGTLALGSGNLTLNAASGSKTFAGSITGSGGLTKLGASTLTLTGQSTYTGATAIGGGSTLALNFATTAGGPTSNLLSSSSALNMGGGTLNIVGAAGEADSQTFNGLNVTSGNNRMNSTAGAGGTMTVNLGAVTRTGGLMDFSFNTGGSFTTSNADGALGGWATVNGEDYAQVAGGVIAAFTTYQNKDNAATWANGDIVSDEGGAVNTAYSGTVSGSVALGGLKYTAAANSTVTVGLGNTLSVDGAIIVASSVGNFNQTIQGGSITGGPGGGTLGVIQNSTGTGTFTIASTIVDNGGATAFAKAGTGKVALSGANTYTGGTTISGGTLSVNSIANGGQASAIGASGSSSDNLVIEGSTLQYSGITTTSDRGFTLVTSGAITAGTIDVANAGANLTFSGLVTSPDNAGLTKTGAGTLTLANAGNDYVGVTTVAGGTLAATTLADGGANSSIGASSSASSNLVLQGGGKLGYIGATTNSDRGFTLGTGGGGIDVSSAATTLTLSGTAVGTGSLTKTGAGTLVLSGTNTYSGGTTISAGTLRAGSAQAFGTGLVTLANTNSATLDINGFNTTFSALQGGGPSGGNVALGAATLTLSGGTGTYAGVISGTGKLALIAGANQTMTGCNHTYTGGTTITGSTLNVDCLANGLQPSGIGASGAASSNLSIGGGGVLQYSGPSIAIDRGLTVSGGDGYVNVAAATTLGLGGAVVGPGRLRASGGGVLVLSGVNTFSGDLVVDAGVMRAGSNSAFGTGFATVRFAGSLDLANFNNSVYGLSDGATAGGSVTLGSGTLTITNGGSVSYGGVISGSGGLIKNGAGIQGISGCNNSYSGSTVINGGAVNVYCLANGGTNSSIGASAASATNLVLNGGLLRYFGAAASTDRQFTLGTTAGSGLDAQGSGPINFTSTAPITLTGTNAARTLTLTGTNTANNSLGALIADNGTGKTALTKSGTGTWILTNSNSTYTGVTTISGGVLGVDKLANGGEASSIGASGAAATNLIIGSGSTLRYTGAGDTTNRLFTLQTGVTFIESSGTGAIVFTDTGPVTLQTPNVARTIALGGTNNGLNTLAGSIGNAGTGVTTLAKNDSGTWVLTGNNTFTGNTVINDGNLMIGNGGTSGNAGAGNVIVNAASSTLSINRSDTFNFTGTLSGPGALAQIGTGTTVLTSAGNAIGATSVNAGTLQVNGALTTATIAMNGAGILTVNGTVGATAGGTTSFTGDAGASTINVNAGGTLRGNGDLGGGNDVMNVSGTLATGGAALNLGAGNDTLVLNDTAVLSGVGFNAGTGGETGTGDTLQVVTTAGRTLDGANVTSFESLLKQGNGILTLTGAFDFSAGTTVQAGVLALGNGTTAGSVAGDIVNNAQVSFNSPGSQTYAGTISGTGSVVKNGTGTMVLTGDNAYSGTTDVFQGALIVNGDQSGATGNTLVTNSGTLGGSGVIGGNVNVASLGRLSPGDPGNSPGTLTINGNLLLGSATKLDFDFGQANVPGGAFNDLINVGGNLTLDGTLNVTQSPGGNFGPGVYRVISYGGALTNNGLNVGSSDYFVQTSVANQVNLVNSAGLALSYWDGDAGPHSNSIVNGGNGTWRAAGDQNWTDATGVFAAPFANASFAVFQGVAGTVNIDNTNGQVQAAGMQFATDGYLVQGGPIDLVGGSSIIRVGDGTAGGAFYTATIASNLTGSSQLVKTDLGTLVLSGTNSYTGGTIINGGTVRISLDTNLGDAAGGLSFGGGTLNTVADMTTGRVVTLAGAGTFLTNAGTTTTLTGGITGAGGLAKDGAGALVVAGDAVHSGGTTITAGILQVGNGATTGTLAGDVTNNATLAFDRSDALIFAGAVTGTGAVDQTGTGTTILTANSSYSGGTTISAGTLQLGNGGATGSITGDVVDDGTLAFNRSDIHTFGGVISGSGAVNQIGTGTTILTQNNTYAGATNVLAGSLQIDGDQSAATGLTSVANGGTLGGTGIIGGDVVVADGGAMNPGDLVGAPGTLTINGGLTTSSGSSFNYDFGQANVPGGAFNDLTEVQDDLVLDGTINVAVSAGGTLGPGLYRVISYGGTLTDNGLDIGTIPSPDFSVQTSVAQQVNLVNTAGLTLNYWDGAAGPKNDSAVNGGDGLWQNSTGNDNWTDSAGSLNAPFSDSAFAIFAGAAGTVTVDNSLGGVSALGMQFATDGYLIQGNDIALVGPQSIIRVGDGTAAGSTYVATIASSLTGSTQLAKTDLGTLVLSGTNSYTGGTSIDGGTVRVAADANLGDAAGGLVFDSGTLHNTAAFSSARGVTLNAGGGTLQTDADLTWSGVIGGTGALAKTGNSTLVLTAGNSYTGPTTVSAGSLFVNGNQSGATGLTSVRNSATLGGTGTVGGNVTIADGAILSPGAADGTPGTLAIAGNLTLSGGSTLNYSFGEANVAGGSLNDLTTVGGNLLLDGTLNVSVSPGGTFGPGVYRVFSYSGALTNNGLSIGTIPSTDYFVQTAIANQVNLINTEGLTLNYWDGAAGPQNNGVIDGGDGLWQNATGNENWTDSTGAVNAPYTDAAFAIFAGAAGTVTVDNSLGQISASGMQFATDGYLIQGGPLELAGPSSIIRVGDGTTAGAGYTATIASALGGSSQLVKTDLGTLVLTGANTYTGGTTIEGGTLEVSSDANLGAAAGALTLENGALHTTASFASARSISLGTLGTIVTDPGTVLTLNGALSGAGNLVKDGSGTTMLGADSSGFTGTTSVEAGILAVNGSLCGDVNVLAGGRLQGIGTVCDTNNAGTVAPGNSIGTLTVAGNYVGNGGQLEIETALGGDASPTDRLVVTGDTAGSTNVKVINVGGIGAQTVEGIKIVDIGGASNGAFSLLGDYVINGEQAVVAGAYGYTLQKNGVSTPSDGDWYLRSGLTSPSAPGEPGNPGEPGGPIYQPGTPLYEAYAQVLQSLNGVSTLQQRVGNRYWAGAGNSALAQGDGPGTLEAAPAPSQGGDVAIDQRGIWARIESAHGKFEPRTSTTGADYDIDTWKVETGIDGQFYESDAGKLIGSLTAHYGHASADITSFFGDGSIDTDGYGLGGTLTWYGQNGFYVDGQAQATWYDSDLTSSTLGTSLTDGNNGFGYAFSLETGKRIDLDQSWTLTPQAQLAYSNVDIDDFTDPFGADVSFGSGDSLKGRIGLSADYQNAWEDGAGKPTRTNLYGIANLYYEFLDGNETDVSGVNFATANDRTWGGIGAGGSYNWNDDKYSLYSEVSINTSLSNFAHSYSLNGTAGFRVKF
ncbi:autotransporter-associated beta strand repeat-containing protein [Phyllobacterium zundukense]|uniref:Autotransporter outer membrane beta-barrel domain-containing protein n=1 Tax=Phyllobacterium zundukense TaxID=1867719 RepID=A0ACD4CX11_9HYPH|nr:autotransporter-associated beta strand repeat-containing protein [Phyllobacterium zundukense]UXN58146.1 autotransporter outer membrane beta-barrel domain-containing protein [Phyllobacterium zundukense]